MTYGMLVMITVTYELEHTAKHSWTIEHLAHDIVVGFLSGEIPT